jgi:hypothetical protein
MDSDAPGEPIDPTEHSARPGEEVEHPFGPIPLIPYHLNRRIGLRALFLWISGTVNHF